MSSLCKSIKSKKYSHLQCPNHSSGGSDFCAKHKRTQLLWVSSTPQRPPLTRKQKAAAEKIQRFWLFKGRRKALAIHGPALFESSISTNNTDIYTLAPSTTIPFTYHFSYSDDAKRIWVFDLRFLMHLLHHGNLKNPYTQEPIPPNTLERLQRRAEILRKQKVPIVYMEDANLTPEQIWNQKVMDVFLKLTSLGYGVNMCWFETMSVLAHVNFYGRLYAMWNNELPLTRAQKDIIVPGYNSGRTILFKWSPRETVEGLHDIRWWRKHNLALMNAFLSRGQDRATQGCGALYILTALANIHTRVGEAFPWLVEE
jgi:hypothetical protein